ncbi:A-kinase anchor protein 11 isoform X2 [Bombina bombina]|uniref:A-kinase anchor protein 11 isoform X2 n=1 Tax=Bombina bombina TaxID=8345 RepID=UPI00235AC3C7|nr:A-kinase anchor protein 11 isoform X2 [Bombina bombina]
MDICTRNQGCQMKPKIAVKKENFSENLLNSVKSLLQSRKELCSISASECVNDGMKRSVTEIMFLGLSEESGAAHVQDLAALHVDLPELIRSFHLCSLNEDEVILMNDGRENTKFSGTQGCFPGIVCVMTTSAKSPYLKNDSLFILLSKYTRGIRYTLEQHCLKKMNTNISHNEDDDTNQSVSSIEDDFVTAFEHLDEEESVPTNENLGECGFIRHQRDAASQTQPSHYLDISGSKIIFSSVRRRSSIKAATLMNFMGIPDLQVKNTVTTSIYDPWKKINISGQHKKIFTHSSAESSDSDCSSPSPVIFLDEEGYQKSMKAKLNLPKIPVVKDGIEDSDSELSEFFDSFDQFDDQEPFLENSSKPHQTSVLVSPPKKKKCTHGQITTAAMNPQKFKSDCPTLLANVRKPTPRKPESPYSNICTAPDSPRPVKTSNNDTGTLFSTISSSAFSPLGITTTAECFYHVDNNEDVASKKDNSYAAYSEYANRVCTEMFNSLLSSNPSTKLAVTKKEEKTAKLARKSCNKETERKLKFKQKTAKLGIQKFATELVEKSFGNAFKDLQKGVTTCTSALCHLAARLTSYVFQMAFYEIGRRQAFSIKKRAINSLANLMVSEVITSALQDLRFIKKQMITNAVTRFAADLAEELVFEGIMEVCQFSHPPTPTVSSCQNFDYENVVVSSYAKDLSESVIQEAFIELSQVNVTFTTQAAISVSMDNLKYVSSEGMMQSAQTSATFPNMKDRIYIPYNVGHESKKDYNMHHALFFTSGLISSIPVPVAAKVLSEKRSSLTDGLYNNDGENVNTSTKRTDGGSHDRLTTNSQLMQHSSALEGCDDFNHKVIKPFSTSMVDIIVNEAYEVMTSSKVTRATEKKVTKKVIDIPTKQDILNEKSLTNHFADELASCMLQHSVDEIAGMNLNKCVTASDLLPVMVEKNKSSELDSKILKYGATLTEHHLVNKSPSSPEYTQRSFLSKIHSEQECSDINSSFSSVSIKGLHFSANKINSEGPSTSVYGDMPVSSMFGFQSCLSHINSFSSAMCSCNGNFFIDDKASQRYANGIFLPGTPPPTPLACNEISPERSFKKLSRKLKGQLAKEFYPATPPSTPHLSAFEPDCMKKDEFMLKLMRSLSEEVESSSSDDNFEDFEISEETSQYADYLSTNIISIATEMAAYCLHDKSLPGAVVKNTSLLSTLSDKWGYPAYMMNLSEGTLDTLCRYASGVAGEVINDAKKVVGKRQTTLVNKVKCDVGYCQRRNVIDYSQKEKGCAFTCMSFKEEDPINLLLPQSNYSIGLTSKYPSCESVTEEYADHIIRVLQMEGGNSELIIDQYASRLVYRAIKSGLQQASKKNKQKCNKRVVPHINSEANSTQEILRLLNRTHKKEKGRSIKNKSAIQSYSEESSVDGRDVLRPQFTGLLHFAESLANTITCDVRQKLKISAASLPKSLTDSCLYTKSKTEDVTDIVKTTYSSTLIPFSQKDKRYHSTGSLNEHGLNEGIMQAIEQYACKVVDKTLEFSMETARLQAVANRKKIDKTPYSGKLVHTYGTACKLCSAKEQNNSMSSSCHFLLGHEASKKNKQCSKSKFNSSKKTRVLHLNVPKIQIDIDKRTIFAEKIVSAAIEKAERELSNTSLAADSGIGHDGSSFAESLSTEVMLPAMKNLGHVANTSSNGKDAESVTSQHTNVSVCDESTGSWSNLSFEDEHQDESSSFLHLSDSNGNSSSWSSLGLEGDMYEENVSFPTSDSDGTEDKGEGLNINSEVIGQHCKALLIRNIDVGPCRIDSQLRTTLQWIVASESGISEIHFHETARKELLDLSRRLREREWKVADLLQAVLQYCETIEKSSNLHKSLFSWLLENS